MFEHDVEVMPRESFVVKTGDFDYFEESCKKGIAGLRLLNLTRV